MSAPSPPSAAPAGDAAAVERVHVVFKTHLDIGYTDLAAAVTERYHREFLPRAVAVAEELAAEGEPFTWTTGSWLVLDHLERLEAAGDAAALEYFEAAVRSDAVAWHALPFTTHTELLDRSLLRYGLTLSERLDARFGRRTTAAKLTDVPGHTRGLVPVLAEAGVTFLHIGVNPASCPPDVPSTFRWRDDASGTEVVVRYHAGGYGDVVVLPGLADALVFAHSGDNDGPPAAAEVRTALAGLRARFPGADVRASTLDAFARAVESVRADLPVVSAELGDTWIHGAASDPGKVARYRELARLRTRWIDDGRLDPELDGARPIDAVHDRCSRSLLLVAEHTWGMDEKVWLPDTVAYDRTAVGDASFARLLDGGTATRFASSWAEQRRYVDDAVLALGDLPDLQREALAALAGRTPVPPDVEAWHPVAGGEVVRLGAWDVGLDPATGALVHLHHADLGRSLADPDHPLGRWRYRTFDAGDYARFRAAYNVNGPEDEWWAQHDFAKVGIDTAGARSRWWEAAPVSVHTDGDRQLVVRLHAAGEAVDRFGHPELVVLAWRFPDDLDQPVTLTLDWFAKPACRFPEASWVSFSPAVAAPERWVLDKLGQDVSPLDVVRHGGRRLHAVGRGARYHGPDLALGLDTLDAPLVAPGSPDLLRFDDEPLELSGGMHVLLHDNVWGTNFPMWYADDERFRFELRAVPT